MRNDGEQMRMLRMVFNRHIVLVLLVLWAAAPSVQAQQQNVPHLGYCYPAGGRQGENCQVTVGGQYLDEDCKVFISGDGIQAKVVSCTKPLTPRQVNDLRQRMDELQKKPRDPAIVKELMEIRGKLAAFRNMMNPAIAEKVTLQITIDANAGLDLRELRLETTNGVSNPLIFQVGQLQEFRKKDPPPSDEPPIAAIQRKNGEPPPHKPEAEMNITLPAVVNGQILPGGVDRYRFPARKGQRLVIVVSARELVPYLADAVPGWFQVVAAVYDPSGNELAYDDHYRFHPDPVLSCRIPKDGNYVLEIRDSLYRGREDFVYRIAAGELPFVTGFFPLGGPAGAQTDVELKGWNLPVNRLSVDAKSELQTAASPSAINESGVMPLTVAKGRFTSNRLPFAVDTLPECLEKEPNNDPATAQAIKLPIIINGRIDAPGDWDVFRFEGRAGEKIVAEVDARKLDSPLDSILKLTDADGRQLAMNDDCADKGDALSTHHADSLLIAELPAKGVYYLWLGDAQHKGGAEYGYRLRVSEPRPDFAIRVVPSGINVRAGGSAPITVYALRKDGFSGDINLALKDAPKGFTLSGGSRIPADKDQVKLTLSAPQAPAEKPVDLQKTLAEKPLDGLAELPEKPLMSHDSIFLTTDSVGIEGKATIQGREVIHPAVPADDMMQAFFYHHLVPAKSLFVAVTRRIPPRLQLKYLGESPAKLPAGQTATLRFSGPRGPLLDLIQLALKEPPEGITVEKFAPTTEGINLLLHADADKVKSGQKGTLLVEVFVDRPVNAEKDKPPTAKRRISMGTLPAIPYEITDMAR